MLKLNGECLGVRFDYSLCSFDSQLYIPWNNPKSVLTKNKRCNGMVLKGWITNTHQFLGAFPKMREATISFTVYVRPVCPHFYDIWYLDIFRKSVEKIQVSLNPDKNNEYFTWKPLCIYDNILHILCSITFFRKSCCYEIMSKNVVELERYRWQYNMRHAHCMLVN
jgi:hypothetical protein